MIRFYSVEARGTNMGSKPPSLPLPRAVPSLVAVGGGLRLLGQQRHGPGVRLVVGKLGHLE